MSETTGDIKVRLDKWLWHARFFKTRTLSRERVVSGKVRVNQIRVTKPSREVAVGDVLTFSQGRHVRVIEVKAISERRGPASEAQTLYKDLSPPEEKAPAAKDETPVSHAPKPVEQWRRNRKDRRNMRLSRASGLE